MAKLIVCDEWRNLLAIGDDPVCHIIWFLSQHLDDRFVVNVGATKVCIYTQPTQNTRSTVRFTIGPLRNLYGRKLRYEQQKEVPGMERQWSQFDANSCWKMPKRQYWGTWLKEIENRLLENMPIEVTNTKPQTYEEDTKADREIKDAEEEFYNDWDDQENDIRYENFSNHKMQK